MKTGFLYALFAGFATGVNLLTQWPVFLILEQDWAIYPAVLLGTFTGLLTKYILDKKWIFYFVTTSKTEDAYYFSLYSFMGVFTTMIFWGTEITFFFLFNFQGAQYVGGALGLMLGYTLKYYLDKKFVFRTTQ